MYDNRAASPHAIAQLESGIHPEVVSPLAAALPALTRPAPLLWVMFLAYFSFGLTGVMGALTPDIIAEFHLRRVEAGLLGTALFLAMALFAIPSGLLADRWGARKVILTGVTMMVVSCFVVSRSHTYALILGMVFAVGTGVTMLQTAGSPMIQHLDAPQNYHRNLTYTIGCCTFGAFGAIFLLAYLRGSGHPWQSFYFWFAALCLVLLGFLSRSSFPARTQSAEPIHLHQIVELLRSPVLITYGLGVYFYCMAEVGIYFWIPKFFEDVHGIPAAVSSSTATTLLGRAFPSLPAFIYALFMGMQGLGRAGGGAVMKRFGAVHVLRIYAVMALISLLVATFGSTWLTAVGFAACGLFTSVLYPLLFSGTINSFEKYHGAISGLLCTSYVASACVPPLQGWLGDHVGMRAAMAVPIVSLTYVIGLTLFGRARYE